MPFSLLPNDIFSHLTDLTPANLQQSGIRLLMMDFDNTIVPYTTDMPTDRMLEWLSSMQQSGIALCVVSNSRKERVPLFCQRYGLSCVTGARKPFGPGILQCLSRYGIPASQSALVGDQIYTDVLGANLVGVHSILISAIHNHTFWLKLRHILEIPIILIAKERNRHDEKPG